MKPRHALLDGKQLHFEAWWIIGDNDRSPYVGEWAMGLVDQDRGMWFVSGDLQDIVHVSS